MHFRWLVNVLAIAGTLAAQPPQAHPPVSVGIVFDTSGSMGYKLQPARQLVMELLKTASPQDEFSLVQYGDRAVLATGFVSNTDQIRDKLSFVQAKGRSAMLDAIYLSLDQAKTARNARKVLLVISDGGDNNSKYTIAEIGNAIRDTGIKVYTAGIHELADDDLLSQVAQAAGARHFTVEKITDLPRLAVEVNTALRSQ